jgi:hypothetical protein
MAQIDLVLIVKISQFVYSLVIGIYLMVVLRLSYVCKGEILREE